MNEYKTIIEERPYNLNPYNINVSGKLQIKNDYVFGFSKDSYISIPYILKSGFNKFLAKISFKRLMSTQQTLLSSSDEKNGFKSIFISRDNKLYYGDKFILDSINKSKEYNISFLFENKSLIVMIENERYEINNIESPINSPINNITCPTQNSNNIQDELYNIYCFKSQRAMNHEFHGKKIYLHFSSI